MGSRLGLVLLSLLPLAACAPSPEGEAAALLAAAERSREVLGGMSLPAAAALQPAPRRPADPGPPGSRPASTAQLLGALPEALRRWLGEPSLRRPEGPAEIWLYASEGCSLDLVLYRQHGALRVAHAAARATGAAPQTEGACLRQLSANAAQRPVPAAGNTHRAASREPGA